MLASPILAVQGGVYLNYLFTLGLGLLFVAVLRRGVREGQLWRLVAAGGLLGWIFLTRPYDAVVWGLLGAVPVVVRERRHLRAPRARRRRGARSACCRSWRVTLARQPPAHGQPHRVPDHGRRPPRPFGFGMRRLMPELRRRSTTARGSRRRAPGSNAFWLPFFLVGAHLGVVIAAAGCLASTSRAPPSSSSSPSGLAFPIAYFVFFGTHISSLTARLSGPDLLRARLRRAVRPDRHRAGRHRSPTTGCRRRPRRGPRARDHPHRRQPAAGEPPD